VLEQKKVNVIPVEDDQQQQQEQQQKADPDFVNNIHSIFELKNQIMIPTGGRGGRAV
jgi:ribosome recycling factor